MKRFIVDGQYKDLLAQFGMDVVEVLRKANLPEDILNHKTITMSEDQYYKFIQAIGDCIGNEEAMIQLSTADQIEMFSPPIFAAWCSKNGEACIERLAAYKKLIGPVTWNVKNEKDNLIVVIKTRDPQLVLPSFLAQSDCAFLIGMLRKATKSNINPISIRLVEKPAGDVLSKFAHVNVQTGEENEIAFRGSDLQRPFVSFNSAMWDYFEPEMNKRLSELDVDDSTSARVRSVLAELLPGGMYGIEDVAKRLGLSKRTLQRKLSEEKTSFQKQLNSARETLALHYIHNTDMTTTDIAFLLGYTETNSFLRAFVIWTGKNVTEYRRQRNN